MKTKESTVQKPTFLLKDVFNMHPLSSLKVFTLERQINGYTQIGAVENGFYWASNDYPDGFGPFMGVFSAMEHHKAVFLRDRDLKTSQKDVKLATVIQVDWKARKRIK